MVIVLEDVCQETLLVSQLTYLPLSQQRNVAETVVCGTNLLRTRSADHA